ncbi:MAG: acetyl-CoA carboxylase biotin carboxylase subunit [Candidatus Heimdallarchaeaceae archaeon]
MPITVLIANRGEIAIRIIRSCQLLNMKSVVVFVDCESTSQHVKMADEAYSLGDGTVQETYLNIQRIINIALKSGADAIHPGYGFLSESSEFAKKVEKNGLIFIGPSSTILENLGDKIKAKQYAREVGIPTVPGSKVYVNSLDEAEEVVSKIAYPIIIKSAFGGGGRGMEIVKSHESLEISLMGCQTISERFFGRKEVFIEKYISTPRHIEIQFIADNYGNTIHLGDRECTIQRMHQKVIEEAPSFLSTEQREELGERVCKLARNISYSNAGTAEFLWNHGEVLFNEINPRIQVEHPVTEMITGIDLVTQQLRIAAGEKLAYKQEEIKFRGHAIEFRINAEDPLHSFYPQSGTISDLRIPGGNFVRFDTFVTPSSKVTDRFDSLIGKLIVWGENRKETIERSQLALKELSITGLITNIGLHRAILETEEFNIRDLTTDFLERNNIQLILASYEKSKLAAIYSVYEKHKKKLDSFQMHIQQKRTMNNHWKQQSKLEQHNNR